MDISVVGAGTVGTAIAVALEGAGHRVVAASGRDATPARVARWLPGVPVVEPTAAAASADVVFVGTPDDEVRHTAAAIAGVLRSGQVIVHLSGALALDVLLPVFTPSPSIPLMSLPRFMLSAFPLFIVLGYLLSRNKPALYLWLLVSGALSVALTAMFVTWRWVA